MELDILKKITHRSKILLSLVKDSFYIWKFSDWIQVWFTNRRKEITIKGLKFQIRNHNYLSKVTDIAMIFEIIHFNHYGICDINPKDIVIDIGAHIGSFTLLASKKANKGKVLSYEPSQESFKLLKENVKINNGNNIILHNEAVGKNSGEGYLFQHKNNAENSLYKKSNNKKKIHLTTLAEIFRKYQLNKCDVLKLDCEGAEYDILFSSGNQLSKVKKIILEYHEPTYFGIDNKYSVNSLMEFLKKKGFKVNVTKDTHYQGIIYAQQTNLLR